MRAGAHVRVYNAHRIWQPTGRWCEQAAASVSTLPPMQHTGLALCRFSTLEIMRYAPDDSPYTPFIPVGHVWAQCQRHAPVLDFVERLRLCRELQWALVPVLEAGVLLNAECAPAARQTDQALPVDRLIARLSCEVSAAYAYEPPLEVCATAGSVRCAALRRSPQQQPRCATDTMFALRPVRILPLAQVRRASDASASACSSHLRGVQWVLVGRLSWSAPRCMELEDATGRVACSLYPSLSETDEDAVADRVGGIVALLRWHLACAEPPRAVVVHFAPDDMVLLSPAPDRSEQPACTRYHLVLTVCRDQGGMRSTNHLAVRVLDVMPIDGTDAAPVDEPHDGPAVLQFRLGALCQRARLVGNGAFVVRGVARIGRTDDGAVQYAVDRVTRIGTLASDARYGALLSDPADRYRGTAQWEPLALLHDLIEGKPANVAGRLLRLRCRIGSVFYVSARWVCRQCGSSIVATVCPRDCLRPQPEFELTAHCVVTDGSAEGHAFAHNDTAASLLHLTTEDVQLLHEYTMQYGCIEYKSGASTTADDHADVLLLDEKRLAEHAERAAAILRLQWIVSRSSVFRSVSLLVQAPRRDNRAWMELRSIRIGGVVYSVCAAPRLSLKVVHVEAICVTAEVRRILATLC